MAASGSGQPLTVGKSEALIRQLTDGLVNIVDQSGEFLLKLSDGSVVDTKGWGGWEWTHGIALTALYRHAALSPSSSSAQYSINTALEWFRQQYKLTEGKGASKNINTMSPFYCLACAVEDDLVPASEKEQWTAWLKEWAEWIMTSLPRTPEGGFQHITLAEDNANHLWDDTLMMTVVPLAKIGMMFGRQDYVDEAKYQMLLHIQYLMDPASGLWYHGYEFTPEGETFGHNFAKALWARGNCWITVSIPLFIQVCKLPPSDPIYKFLVSTLKRQLDALIPLLDKETGLFHTLLPDPTSYVETSATAGFAAGAYMAIKMGLIPTEPYIQLANTSLLGVIRQIQPDGEVANVSFGTGVGYTLQHYKDIPITSMPYGQALAMWALVEWESLQTGNSEV